MGIPFDRAVRYFLLADIWAGFKLGMKYFLKPKATLNYPFEKGPLSPRFRGEHALHRVTPVGGTQRRLIALYLYDPLPDRQSVRSSNLRLYGPEAEAAMDAVGMDEPPAS